MSVLELAFDDNPERRHRRASRTHSQRRGTRCDSRRRPYADGLGSTVVLTAATLAEAKTLVDEDPYYTAPAVAVVSPPEWNVVTRHAATATP